MVLQNLLTIYLKGKSNMYTLIGYKKCSTCKNAENYLKEKGINYVYRNIKENNPKEEEIRKYIKLSGKDIKSFFNTSGLVYKSLNLKEKLQSMNFDEKVKLLASDGMIVKRPILIINDKVLVGFKIKEWDSLNG